MPTIIGLHISPRQIRLENCDCLQKALLPQENQDYHQDLGQDVGE